MPLAAERGAGGQPVAGEGGAALWEDTVVHTSCQSGRRHEEALGPSPGAPEGHGGCFLGRQRHGVRGQAAPPGGPGAGTRGCDTLLCTSGTEPGAAVSSCRAQLVSGVQEPGPSCTLVRNVMASFKDEFNSRLETC